MRNIGRKSAICFNLIPIRFSPFTRHGEKSWMKIERENFSLSFRDNRNRNRNRNRSRSRNRNHMIQLNRVLQLKI